MKSSKSIAVYALMTALVAVATVAIRIPMPATDGYLNLGDAFVLFCGVVFGPFAGVIAGGIGSALADLLGGYAHWMLPTFLIKGVEGALAGGLFLLLKKGRLDRFFAAGVVSVIALLEMITGYFFASWIMKGSAAVAWTSVPGNVVQGAVGAVLAMLLLFATSKIRGFGELVGKNQFFESHKPKESKDVTDDE